MLNLLHSFASKNIIRYCVILGKDFIYFINCNAKELKGYFCFERFHSCNVGLFTIFVKFSRFGPSICRFRFNSVRRHEWQFNGETIATILVRIDETVIWMMRCIDKRDLMKSWTPEQTVQTCKNSLFWIHIQTPCTSNRKVRRLFNYMDSCWVLISLSSYSPYYSLLFLFFFSSNWSPSRLFAFSLTLSSSCHMTSDIQNKTFVTMQLRA